MICSSLNKSLALSVALSITSAQAAALDLKEVAFKLTNGHTLIHLGGFLSHQGKAQFGGVQGLIGDDYTVTQHHDSNGLFGAGYYLNGPERPLFNLSYGINAFYLPKTYVNGQVVAEKMFTNLAYDYSITHLPVYAALKAIFNRPSTKRALTLDVGIGPNVMKTANFHERPLDGITLPDNAYTGHTSAAFSAMAGIGIKINNVFGHAPLECGYRFMYLGQGHLNKTSNQMFSNLKTGQNHVNAVVCGLTI